MEWLKKASIFLRLIDENNQLSITNIAVYIVLVKIALVQDFNITDAGALFVCLLNYSGKKYLKHASEKKKLLSDEEGQAFKDKVTELEKTLKTKLKEAEDNYQKLHDKVGAVQAAQSMTKLR